MISRKTLLTIFAVLGAILGVFKSTFGLSLDSTAILAGASAVLLYVFFEAKADRDRIKAQIGKFKDPKFIITLISAILAALQSSGVALPVNAETIIAILTVVVGILFKVQSPNPA